MTSTNSSPVSHEHIAIHLSVTTDDYPTLVEIWRSSVLATHDFLAESDFEAIAANLATSYFPAVTLTIATRQDEAVGFAGTLAGQLEMLFVAADARRTGVGSALLTDVITNQGVTKVDVNEQNQDAVDFYLSHQFIQIDRSPLDSDGRPYPILHLVLPG